MKTSKKSRADIQRAYRQRRLANNAEEVREKERKRWHMRRTQKKVKSIGDFTDRQKRIIRRRWRTKKAEYRTVQRRVRMSTPPSSDEGSSFGERTKRGRAKLAYRHTKAYRQVATLTKELQTAKCCAGKYKKRWLRLKMSHFGSQVSSECSSTDLSTPVSTQSEKSAPIRSHHSHGNSLDTETKEMIEIFLTRDDNSRMTTGKKQTVTKNKDKRQKRLLLDSLINLHEKFSAENPRNNISYATFTRHRPFWVRQATAKDRDTCLCKKHENLQLAADKLHQLGALKTKNIEEILKQVCCNVDNLNCMFRECELCVGKRVDFEEKSLLKDESIIVWSEWAFEKQEYEKDGQQKSTKVMRKTVKRGTLKELKTKFCQSVRGELGRHVYIIRHQFRAYKHLKETVDVNEAVVHVDFSENYACKHAEEIQSAYFGASNRQASLHTGVLYTMDGLQSFATISASWRHDPAAIWAHMQPVLQELKSTNPQISDLHFFSDGPTTQYRNKQNFFLMSTLLHDMGFEAGSWNFFESGHGKGAPDAIGGSVKRQADAFVLTGFDIPDAKKLYHCLESAESLTKFYFIDDRDITSIDSRCCNTVRAITGTMKLHQVQTDERLNVSYRNLSCFCQRPTICTCYDLHRYKFPAVVSKSPVSYMNF